MVKSRSAKIGDWIIVFICICVYSRLSPAGVEYPGAILKLSGCLD